jgi:transcriptional regulator with PAS, ATPase and Fis domain
VILARGTTVTVRELPPEIVEGRSGLRTTETLDLKANEQLLIRQALEKFKRNRKRAAEALNISPVTLWRKMKEYGLSEE